MLGAIIGDVVGSRFEFDNIHTKDFEFFHPDCHITDDSAMTIAVMAAILEGDLDDEQSFKATVIDCYKRFWMLDPDGDYGFRFFEWLDSDSPKPYNSYGNGACMRISPCAVLGDRRSTVARWATEVSHNHPIALNWVELFTSAIKDLKAASCKGSKQAKDILQKYLDNTMVPQFYSNYYHTAPITEVVKPGTFDETVQGTVPMAIKAVLESTDFEDAIRTAVSYGGDTDTIACIAGALAEAVYGVPTTIKRAIVRYIPVTMINTIQKFNRRYKEYA